MTDHNDATLAQIDAASPTASTWLSANAGSGKTRVLTDRVARLLLLGVPPQRILCLTYTKAAASEMQNRLFKRLGAWAMLDDETLTESLSDLGVTESLDLNRARTLFARAIETPGGLKIQTIHSFCASLLRQFPLEAGVSPQFREMDDAARERLIEAVLDSVTTGHQAEIETLGRHYSGQSLADLAMEVVSARDRFGASRHTCFEALGLQDGDNANKVLSRFPKVCEDERWLEILGALSSLSKSYRDFGSNLASLDLSNLSQSDFEFLDKTLLYQSGSRKNSAKIGGFPQARHTSAVEALAPFSSELESLMKAVEQTKSDLLAVDVAKKTVALHAFAAAFLPAYADAKSAQGLLDFDDLITCAKDLLVNVDMAWILFRLDGGIDHILVDEAQDTSPEQWAVIQALSEEMAAGQGAREVPRTLFVVGDKKQSIYSFQGADARGFDAMRGQLLSVPTDTPGLRERALTYSFRSAPVILQTVDRVFQGEASQGLGDDIVHRAFHDTLPGRVDLWDLEAASDMEETPPWYSPVDRTSEHSPRVRLAKKVAAQIDTMLETVSIQGENGENRRVEAGDILILVRSRGELFDAIIRACKTANLPIAGADQLRINAELAVRDIMALLSFLALQDDDLSLAAALRSPLFGWSEKDLYALAQPRGDNVRLWQAMRAREDEFSEGVAKLYELRRRAEFLRPYELIELILTRMGGRKALVARLGGEAEDGIDELLNQALAYEQSEIPTLTGFVQRVQANEVKVKRRLDASGGLIRVMTIHGAKGLEAPIVILPDTIHKAPSDRGTFLAPKDGIPVWNVSKDDAPAQVRHAKDAAAEAALEEDNRLLYVAMTRAAKWLIVAGAEPKHEKQTSWWASVQGAMEAAGATRLTEGDLSFLRLENGDWPAQPEDAATTGPDALPHDPAPYLREDAAHQPAPTKRLSPSKLGGAKVMPGDPGEGDVDAAKAYGTLIHRLLEVLPQAPRETWSKVAERLISNPSDDADPMGEAATVIDAFPDVFTHDALSEVDLTAPLGTEALIFGAADRIVFEDGVVRIIDFKTNTNVPTTPAEVPEGVLRQLGAYLIAAEQIWPDHTIDVEVIWTRGPTRMVLPHAIVRDAFQRTPIS